MRVVQSLFSWIGFGRTPAVALPPPPPPEDRWEPAPKSSYQDRELRHLEGLRWLRDNGAANQLDVPPAITAEIAEREGAREAARGTQQSGGPQSTARFDRAPGGAPATPALMAARWAAEAIGVDWTRFDDTRALKKALAPALEEMGLSIQAGPFYVKRQIMERLGLIRARRCPSSALSKNDKRTIAAFRVETLREKIAERAALGLPRLPGAPHA